MDDLVKEIIPLLQYLIPGFLSAWVFYSLTAFKRPDTFGQIVQALVFTFVIQGAVLAVGNFVCGLARRDFLQAPGMPGHKGFGLYGHPSPAAGSS